MAEHSAQYEYNRHAPHIWRVTCSCGWFYIGSREQCETRFTGHDLGQPEWVRVERVPAWRKRLDEIKGREP